MQGHLETNAQRKISIIKASTLPILLLITWAVFLNQAAFLLLTIVFVFVAYFHRQLLEWRNMLLMNTAIIMLVPVRLYKLPSFVPFDLEPYRLVVMMMLLFWFIALIIDPSVRLRKTKLDASVLFFGAAVLLSYLVNFTRFEAGEEFTTAFKALLTIASCIILYFYTTSVMVSRHDIERALKLIIALASVLSVLAVVERQTGYNVFRHLHEFVPLLSANTDSTAWGGIFRGGLRVSGSTSHPIAFGTLLGLVFPISYYYMRISKETKQRIMYSVCLVLIALGAMTTISRTSFFALAASMTVLILALPKDRTSLIAFGIVGIIVIHLLMPGVLHQIKTHLTPSYFETNEVGNNNGRIEDYPIVYGEFLKMPLLGRGFGTYDPKQFIFLDNQYLGSLVELGLLGLLAFAGIFINALRHLKQTMKLIDGADQVLLIVLMAVVTVFMIASFTFDTLGFPQPTYLFFILLGISFSFIRILQADMQPKTNV